MLSLLAGVALLIVASLVIEDIWEPRIYQVGDRIYLFYTTTKDGVTVRERIELRA